MADDSQASNPLAAAEPAESDSNPWAAAPQADAGDNPWGGQPASDAASDDNPWGSPTDDAPTAGDWLANTEPAVEKPGLDGSRLVYGLLQSLLCGRVPHRPQQEASMN